MDLTQGSFLSVFSVVVGATTFLLGLFVYLANRESLTNRVFFVLTLSTVFWIAAVLVAISVGDKEIALLARKSAFVAASSIAFLIYYFSYLFPKPNKQYKFPFWIFLLVGLSIASISMFTDYVLKDVSFINGDQVNVYGPGYYLFSFYFFLSLVGGVYNFASKKRDLGRLERLQLGFVLTGLLISGILGASTNLILPRLLGTYSTGQLGPLGVSIFVILSTYAILKHHLCDIRVIAVEVLTSVMWLFILFRFLSDDSVQGRVLEGVLLIAAVFFGSLLIRSVIKEVKQRENVEKLAKDLEDANKKLETLDAARKEFLSFASHQLKTPMTVIKGYAVLANDQAYLNDPLKMKQVVGKIARSTDQMYRLISNFLDVRAIEEGRINYLLKPTDVVKLTSSLVEDLKPYAEQKGLKLSLASGVNSAVVSADETKLRQVVQNLVDNSIKYTDKGSVEVRVSKEGGFVFIVVSDTGRGISPTTKEHLFEQFFRDGRAALKSQGTGLGLYIAKEIVKAHRGKIWAESDGEGKGSKFTVELPK